MVRTLESAPRDARRAASRRGLFAERLSKLEHIDQKLDAPNRYSVHINPQTAGYSQRQVGDLYPLIQERFHALPGVEKVGISSYTPTEAIDSDSSVQVQGKPDSHLVRHSSRQIRSISIHRNPCGAGRGISAQDTADSLAVAVANEAFVGKLFQPGENPIGQHFGVVRRRQAIGRLWA